jgi:methionine-rich copper-binding protein CopC
MFVSSGADKAAIVHPDSVGVDTRKTNLSREYMHEMYRLVLEELQKGVHTVTYRKMLLNNSHRDLLGQHHI